MKIEYRKISEIIPYEHNPRDNDAAVDAVAQSIREFGFRQPILVEHALLLPAKDAAKLCGVSERTWRSWDASGRVPQAIEIGRSKFWRRYELEAWVTQGCPDRGVWQAIGEES